MNTINTEKENIFEDAKFGDKFLTATGEIVIYHSYNKQHHLLIAQDGNTLYCTPEGKEQAQYDYPKRDVVSKVEDKTSGENLLQYTPEQLSALVIQDKAYIALLNENYQKLQAENNILKEKLRMIKNILD